jgi:hypothetical protein
MENKKGAPQGAPFGFAHGANCEVNLRKRRLRIANEIACPRRRLRRMQANKAISLNADAAMTAAKPARFIGLLRGYAVRGRNSSAARLRDGRNCVSS